MSLFFLLSFYLFFKIYFYFSFQSTPECHTTVCVCVFLTFCFLTSALVICIGFGLHGESLLEVGRRPDNTKSGLCVCDSYVVPP